MRVLFVPPLLRRAAGAVLGTLLVLLVGPGALPGAAVARADTGDHGGGPTPFMELVRSYEVVALVEVREAPPDASAWTIEVLRGYHGAAPGLLTIEPVPADPDFQVGERWLLFTSTLQTLDVRTGLAAYRVEADGTIEAHPDIEDMPATIEEVDAVLGPAPTPDSASTVSVRTGSADPALTLRDALPAVALGFVLAVLAVFLAAAAVASRRLARSR